MLTPISWILSFFEGLPASLTPACVCSRLCYGLVLKLVFCIFFSFRATKSTGAVWVIVDAVLEERDEVITWSVLHFEQTSLISSFGRNFAPWSCSCCSCLIKSEFSHKCCFCTWLAGCRPSQRGAICAGRCPDSHTAVSPEPRGA